MADGFKPIPRCKPGGVSLVSADYANMLIDFANAIGGGKVAPIANVGKFLLAGGQFILDLSVLDQRLRALEGGAIGNVQAQINAINNRLDNANIIANGSCSGNNISINISLNI